MNIVNEYLNNNRTEKHPWLTKKLECNDGFKMSVQASEFHYCTPRINTDRYYEFEVGFPTEKEDLLMPYAEDYDNPTDTVYGYVPIEVIEEIITKHGGIQV